MLPEVLSCVFLVLIYHAKTMQLPLLWRNSPIWKKAGNKIGRVTHRCPVGCQEGFKIKKREHSYRWGSCKISHKTLLSQRGECLNWKSVILVRRFHTDCVKFFNIHQRRPRRFTYCMQYLFYDFYIIFEWIFSSFSANHSKICSSWCRASFHTRRSRKIPQNSSTPPKRSPHIDLYI